MTADHNREPPRVVRHRRVLTVGVAAALCLASAVGSTALAGDVPAQTDPTPIDVDALAGSRLDALQGEEAVEELVESGTLGAVAGEVGMEPDELVDELRDDSSLFLTGTGELGYAEAVPLDAPESPVSESLALPLGVDASALSSIPSSSLVIYLDFDGHSTNDPFWGAFESAPFDLDGVPGSFSATEQAVIAEVWQRVSEDFAPFDVNVTTIDPGVEALRRTSSSDARYGQRMVITPTNFVGSGVLGIALVDVFASSLDRPAFVFSGSASAKTIAEASSHEAGHTLGLSHDRFGSLDYYDGHGSWAPIMGRGISKTVTQWSRGEFSGASNFEDDLAIIADETGYRPDDHGGGDNVCATAIASSSSTIGVIGTTGDRDVFAVDVGAGGLGVTLRPPPGTSGWSNLLARLTVKNSSGQVVASAIPGSPSGWVLAVNPLVPAGRYTIEVDPTFWQSPSNTGFSTYGSLGAYELAVAGAPGGVASPACTSILTPLPPQRLIDTRGGLGGFGRVGPGRQIVLQVTNGATVPNGATAAVFNITAVTPLVPGFLTAYPCSTAVPDTSTVNFVGGQTVANTTIAALSSAGQLCVWTSAETDILVDITGWLGPGGTSRLTPIGPERVVDTRNGLRGSRLSPGATLQVDLNDVVPAGTSAVALNATAVGASEPAFLTVFPCGPLPDTSTVNYVAGEARPNNTIVGLSAGRFCIYSFAETDVLIDLVGSFGPTGFSYKPTAPTRVFDTRQFRPPLVAGDAIAYSVSTPALGGTQPGAAFVNVTAANHTVPGFVTTYDCGVRRDTSTLNQQVGQGTANGAIVPLSGLQSCVWTFGGGDLIVDLNGWWVP